jgi:hypothetical protein
VKLEPGFASTVLIARLRGLTRDMPPTIVYVFAMNPEVKAALAEFDEAVLAGNEQGGLDAVEKIVAVFFRLRGVT